MSGLALVTGATSGIGRATAFELARGGMRVIVHGRDPARVRETAEAVRNGGGVVEEAVADLSSQAQVRSLAADLARRFGELDVLLNNAGVYMHHRRLTDDGIETTFAVNVLAPYLLTQLLLPLLLRSAPSRIVNVASVAHQAVRAVDFGNLQGERHYGAYGAYALSKLGDILITYAQAARLEGEDVTANALHPGVISTKLLHAGFGFGGAPPEKGAQVEAYVAMSEEVEGVTGAYFTDHRPTLSSPLTYDEELQARFWAECERLTGVAAESPAR
ncbi:MAG TPA: SDR family NAD(P)-dependent oxidoreductase [Coriobacteriia bacterium]|jgi:NAD(P)-dependent dehydrogenase (short-subunit alcohol dehydrogenase family)